MQDSGANPFFTISDRDHAKMLALAFRVAHDPSEVYAVLRGFEAMRGLAGGKLTAYLSGYYFADDLGDPRHAFDDAQCFAADFLDGDPVLRASDLDLNATIYVTGSRAGCEHFQAVRRLYSAVIARFADGTFCLASKPAAMRGGGQ